MYLINTSTLRLECFMGSCPPYAILSHTWGTAEFTFAELEGEPQAKNRTKTGFRKISLTCEQAQRDGLEYAWVDSCCINKESSAELSEAINSMFNWYSKAAICYAYIEDLDEKASAAEFSALKDCRWVTRGWTLQELLAPREIIFYAKGWIEIGRKSNMRAVLEDITGVPQDVLEEPKNIGSKSVAARMSWAARRETKREEDMAYCLLGIFDVNMPMVYGEGRKAFIRLQEEIMRQSDDDSLFTWCSSADDEAMAPYRGLFASSPREFQGCADIGFFTHQRSGTTMLGNGQVSLSCSIQSGENKEAVIGLKCFRSHISELLGITVVPTGDNTYLRSNPSRLVTCAHVGSFQNIAIKKHALENEVNLEDDVHRRDSIQIGHLPDGLTLASIYPKGLPYSTSERISIVDAIGKKIAFELVLDKKISGNDTRFVGSGEDTRFLILLWVEPITGSRSYEYYFDVQVVSAGDSLSQFTAAPRPVDSVDHRELKAGWSIVCVIKSKRVVEGYEIQTFDIHYGINGQVRDRMVAQLNARTQEEERAKYKSEEENERLRMREKKIKSRRNKIYFPIAAVVSVAGSVVGLCLTLLNKGANLGVIMMATSWIVGLSIYGFLYFYT